jgi:hypothetical protein
VDCEVLTLFLPSLQNQSEKDAALLLFKDLVQNQAPCFAGDEASVFSLLLILREDLTRTVRSSPPSRFLVGLCELTYFSSTDHRRRRRHRRLLRLAIRAFVLPRLALLLPRYLPRTI